MKPTNQGGRPREFDPEQALAAATSVFWKQGYSHASVDAVAAQMKMSKPSVYSAFGGKEQLYRRSLSEFCEGLVAAINNCDISEDALETVLIRFFDSEIDYYHQDSPPRGCFLFCTAPTETANCPEVRAILATTIRRIDKSFEQLLKNAVRLGKLPDSVDLRVTAMSLQSVMQTLAIRIRAGQSAPALKRYVKAVVPVLLAAG